MDGNPHLVYPLKDRSYLSMVRRDIMQQTEKWGFTENEVGKFNIIVSELTSNLIKHTEKGGLLLLRPLGDRAAPYGVEIISIDQGPGMKEPHRMMEDGVSTFGTAGQGLGAIKRQANVFDMQSTPGAGTVILARLFCKNCNPDQEAAINHAYGAVVVPKTGETSSGDAWTCSKKGNVMQFSVFDGLGHGPDAEVAARAAIQALKSSPSSALPDQVRYLHTQLKGTRGAVGSIAQIDMKEQQLRYCGVGNIASRLVGPGFNKTLPSYNGIIGHSTPNTLHDHGFKLEESHWLIITSDGLKTRWEWSGYPGLGQHDPAVIAAVIFRDCNRGTDDSLVLVVRLNALTRHGR